MRSLQSDMYRVNDLIVNGGKIQNVLNTPDTAFHAKYTKSIGGLWTLRKLLEVEPLMDETITKFTAKLGTRFVDHDRDERAYMTSDWVI